MSERDLANFGGDPHRSILCVTCAATEAGLRGDVQAARAFSAGPLTVALVCAGPAERLAVVQERARAACSELAGAELIVVDAQAESMGASTRIVEALLDLLRGVGAQHVHLPSPADADLERRSLARAGLSALATEAAKGVSGIQLVNLNGSPRTAPLERDRAARFGRELATPGPLDLAGLPRATAVVSTWNKKDDLRANLLGLRSQTLPFDEIVVVDNASKDGTPDMVRAEFPEVRLIVMPHDRLGACETFNIGFKSVSTELTAILDDDIVMPPNWLELATLRMTREPATTAIVSTQVVEPGTPESYLRSPLVNEERYMSTFRGCASLARSKALAEADYYDERLFIYGNERDLTCRLLNLGYRVLQYPGCGVFHSTPFGIKMGKRSLYYHARNAWLSMFKYAPLGDLLRMPWLVLTKVILRGERKEVAGEVADATGTIGIGRSLRETKGAWWVLTKAGFSVLANLPYCWKHRQPVRAPDFELPLH